MSDDDSDDTEEEEEVEERRNVLEKNKNQGSDGNYSDNSESGNDGDFEEKHLLYLNIHLKIRERIPE